MIYKATPDIAMFLSGSDATKDSDVVRMAGAYLRASGLADARYWCYAIIGHGTPGSIAGTHISNAIQRIHYAYHKHGKDRVLLVLSCALGYGSAKTLASRLKTNVIAPRTTVMVSDSGQIELQPESKTITIGTIQMQPRADWIYVKPNGSMKLRAENILDLGSAGRFFDL